MAVDKAVVIKIQFKKKKKVGFLGFFTCSILITTANILGFKLEQIFMNEFLLHQEIEISLVVLESNNNANIKKGESEIIYTAGYYSDYSQKWSW